MKKIYYMIVAVGLVLISECFFVDLAVDFAIQKYAQWGLLELPFMTSVALILGRYSTILFLLMFIAYVFPFVVAMRKNDIDTNELSSFYLSFSCRYSMLSIVFVLFIMLCLAVPMAFFSY